MKSRINILTLVILSLFIVSCASMGIKAPETTEEKINFSVATMTGLTKAVTENIRIGLVSVDDGKEFLTAATEVQALVRTARVLLAEDNDADALEIWVQMNLILIDLNQRYNVQGGQ